MDFNIVGNKLYTKENDTEGYALYNRYYNYYLYKMINLAASIFEWKGLPPEIDERFLELTLMMEGAGVFFHGNISGVDKIDDILGENAKTYGFSKVVFSGELDLYHNPKDVQGITIEGSTARLKLKSDDAILCFNNYTRTPITHSLHLFASELADIKMTKIVNREHVKMPVVFATNSDSKFSLKNFIQKIKGYNRYAIVGKNFDLPTVIDMKSNYLGDKLDSDLQGVWNDFLISIGIEIASEKKERLLSSESIASQGEIEMSRYVMLNARRQSAKLISEKWGLNVTVDFRSLNTEIFTDEDKKNQSLESGEENGTIHD